jgi:hypothetical protein
MVIRLFFNSNTALNAKLTAPRPIRKLGIVREHAAFGCIV